MSAIVYNFAGMKRVLFYALAILLLAGCKAGGGKGADALAQFTDVVFTPEFSDGFKIYGAPGKQSTLIKLNNLWQGADSTAAQYLLIARDGEKVPEGFPGQVIKGDARRIVCMSSGQVAMLDAIDATDRIVAVSGIDFITNPRIQAGRDTIADIGYDSNVDMERLVSLRPDLVMLYGVEGAHPIEPKLRELGIPYVYIGEYMEQLPLGKAEWVIAVGEMIGKREEARSEFRWVPDNYLIFKEFAAETVARPKVMVNTPYNDAWMMPSTQSYAVKLISDAGGEYVYRENNQNRSVPIDLEQAYTLLDGADFWLNTGQYTTLGQLTAAFPKMADTQPVRNGNVWNNNLKSTPGGGNDYWESGVVRPDIVLADLISILHPEIADRLPPRAYYHKLQ